MLIILIHLLEILEHLIYQMQKIVPPEPEIKRSFPSHNKFFCPTAALAPLAVNTASVLVSPVMDVNPGPVGPVGPFAPVVPCGPVGPAPPVEPVVPCGPVGPVGPVEPVVP
jgi:hypothetical protein